MVWCSWSVLKRTSLPTSTMPDSGIGTGIMCIAQCEKREYELAALAYVMGIVSVAMLRRDEY